MSDAVQVALIASLTPLIISAFAGLRWWIERRDAQRKVQREEATRELSESEAGKTIRTLTRQKGELEQRYDRLEQRYDDVRGELHETLMDLASCRGGGQLPRDST